MWPGRLADLLEPEPGQQATYRHHHFCRWPGSPRAGETVAGLVATWLGTKCEGVTVLPAGCCRDLRREDGSHLREQAREKGSPRRRARCWRGRGHRLQTGGIRKQRALTSAPEAEVYTQWAAASTFPNPTGLCTPAAVHQRPGYSCGRWKTPRDVRSSVGTQTHLCLWTCGMTSLGTAPRERRHLLRGLSHPGQVTWLAVGHGQAMRVHQLLTLQAAPEPCAGEGSMADNKAARSSACLPSLHL